MSSARVVYRLDTDYIKAEVDCETESPDALTDCRNRAAALFADALGEVVRLGLLTPEAIDHIVETHDT